MHAVATLDYSGVGLNKVKTKQAHKKNPARWRDPY